MFVEVLVEIKTKRVDKTFTYSVPNDLKNKIQIGKRVLVPFGKQKIEGFILNIIENKNFDYEIKNIIEIIDEKPVLNRELLKLGQYIKEKTLCNLITAYQTMLPVALRAKHKIKINKKYVSYLYLNMDYNEAINLVNNDNQKEIINKLKDN